MRRRYNHASRLTPGAATTLNQTEPTTPGLSRLEGSFAVLMTLVGWSSVPLFLRYFADEIDVWTSNGWRYGFSAILWAPVLILGARRRTLPRVCGALR